MRHSFFCIDSHTCGNPVRLVAGGGPLLPHLPISERRDLFVRNHDWVRQALMFEPRGHDIMSGAVIYPAYRDDCDFAVIFIEVSGCLPMCGAGTIGLVTAAIEEGLVTPRIPGRLSIETPAGKVDIQYDKPGEFVESVRIFNVASYLHAADVEVNVPGLGKLVVDIAYGGNYYAVIEPQVGWPGLDGMTAGDVVDLSQKLRDALGTIAIRFIPTTNGYGAFITPSGVTGRFPPRRMGAARCSTATRPSTVRQAARARRLEWRNCTARAA